jgi:predicted metal-dependent HD superfamily phosphohydrolase
MMGQLEPIWSGLEDPDAVVVAVCYHDVVYNVARKDNEERSAEFMRKRLQGLHITDACLDRAQRHVLATKTHSAPRDADTQFLVDADLAILGAPAHAYDLYARSIRQEYRRYPGFLYVPGRRKVLLHFLSMPVIFCTPYFRERYEDIARSNLQRELDQLAGTW